MHTMRNSMRKTTLTICLFLCICGVAIAQTEPDSVSGDPFKNDPFFSSPIRSFFDKSTGEHDSLRQDRDVKTFVNNLNDEGLDFRGVIEAGPYNSNALYSVYPNLPMIHYNRVDALFLGLRRERMQWFQQGDWLGIPNIQLHGMLGYSTGQKEWQYTVGVEKLLGRKEHVMIGGEYHNATSTNDQWRVGLTETTLTSFIAGYDYLDYYKQRGWGAYLLLRSDRLFEGGIALNNDRYHSLNQKTDWALFGSGGRYRVNPPVEIDNGFAVNTVDVSALTISASFNPKRLVLNRNFTFSLSGIAEFADPDFGDSDYRYSKYTAELISYINFEPGGVLKYRLRSSSITGEAPRFKKLYLGGVGTLRALPFKSIGGGNQMLLSNAEILFGKPKMESGGWIEVDDFYLTLFLDSGWLNYDRSKEISGNPFTGFGGFSFSDLRHNGGIGLGSSLLRFELAWDLNYTERAPVFWIRFNPTF